MIIIKIIIIKIIIIKIINNNAYFPILKISPRASHRAHVSPDLPKKAGIFLVKIVRN